MARHSTRTLLRRQAIDGNVKVLQAPWERLCKAALNYADAKTIFEKAEANESLVDAAYFLIWAAQQAVRGGVKPDGTFRTEIPHGLVDKDDACSTRAEGK